MRSPPVSVQLLFYATVISAVGVLPPYSHLEVPFAHVALSGDLHVSLHAPPTPLPELQLAILRLDAGITHFLADIKLHPAITLQDQKQSWDSINQNWIQNQNKNYQNSNKDQNKSWSLEENINNEQNSNQNTEWNKKQTQNQEVVFFTVPCGYFVKGGTYLLKLHGAGDNLTEVESIQDSKLSGVLDVRWPSPKLTLTPENIQTFPEHSVTGIVEFPEVMCPPAELSTGYLPEFWLELWFCGDGGPALCSSSPLGAPLYTEAVRGLSGKREVVLRCELFGIAGTYALTLRPTLPQPTLTTTTAYLKASWSEQFVLTVHARSVLPCDAHAGGVPVLLQYPACVLERADRVRVFARPAPGVPGAAGGAGARPDYVAELRVSRGAHSLRFPCELFSERYPEYCFVYVSQAVSGAVSDVREECLPTLPIMEGALSGGWGPWSPWSPCSGRCGGTRARYRYCDSPPPPYGAPYCQGPAVNSEPCILEGQPCPWAPGSQGPAGDPCRCGCALRLGTSPRHLSASAQECQGRTFWLLQVAAGHVLRLTIERYRLPCGAQWLKARDGGSPGAPLLGQWPGDGASEGGSESEGVTSSGDSLLLEFFSDELLAAGQACPGGFIASAAQVEPVSSNASASIAVSMGDGPGSSRVPLFGGALVFGALGAAGLLLAAPALCWIILRALHATSKYQRANDCDSLADSDMAPGSTAVLGGLGGSRGTLLSEVLSLRRLRSGPPAHRLLRESRDLTEEGVGGIDGLGGGNAIGADSQAGGWSSGSSITIAAIGDSPQVITNRPGSGGSLPVHSTAPDPEVAPDTKSSPLRRSRTCSPARSGQVNVQSMVSDVDSPSISMDMSASERDSDASYDPRRMSDLRRAPIRRSALSENSSESVSTLTNGCYSPALSTTSCARVRATGGKERKERRNLRLRAPVSDLSLTADLELDYYDYNVKNAGAVPGSYLGMDPAFLIWIPPLDELDEIHNHTYEEILPRPNVDPGSNTESPEDFNDQPHSAKLHFKTDNNTPQESPKIDRKLLLAKNNIVHPLNFSVSDLAPVKAEPSFDISKLFNQRHEPLKQVSIPMKDFTFDNKFQESVARSCSNSEEKETVCEKLTNEKYVDITDIQFADDDSDGSGDLKNEDAGEENGNAPNNFVTT